MQNPHPKSHELVRELATNTNVSEAEVRKVLDYLGLSEALACVESNGMNLANINHTHAKLAFRVKNMVCV